MKTILEINTSNYSSTGNIMLNIAKVARSEGYNVYTCCKNSKSSQRFNNENNFFIGYRLERIISQKLCYLTGLNDHFNIINTIWLINKINKIKPDLLHFHVIEENFINLNIFTKYLKKINKPIVWTFHCGSPFTGGCGFFLLANCYKWKTQCEKCPLRIFEKTSLFFDTSSLIQKEKKKWYARLNNLTIVTPSKWLANNVKESFLKDNKILVINNGINLNTFKPTESTFKKDHHIENKKVILGITFMWNDRKGIKDFIRLANDLSKDEYAVVMVGHIDEGANLPNNVIHIEKTYDQIELAKIYTCADVFVNTTYEDNFPTVNLESLACGTPVLTYNTGGSPEAIDDNCGAIVDKGDYNQLIIVIKRICETNPYTEANCLNRAKLFDMNDTFKKYADLYNQILKK